MSRIRHIEIAGTDGGRLRAFYEGLFGWEISHRPVEEYDYYDVNLGEELTAGIRHEPDGPAEIVIYVEVGDLDQAVEIAEELGARVRIPPMEHGELRFALIEDPEGNPVGLTQRPAPV